MLENSYRIVADGGKPEAAALEVFPALLQLDELALAERSPVSRAVENNHGPFRTGYSLQRLLYPVLVAKSKVAEPHTDFRSQGRERRDRRDQQGDTPCTNFHVRL
jgi:hypothetical protein